MILITLILLLCSNVIAETPDIGSSTWGDEIRTVEITSSADRTKQKAYWYNSGSSEKKPLLIGLHSWSTDYTYSPDKKYADEAIKRDWVMIHPNFRGGNFNPEAGGSRIAMQDILDARKFALRNANIDKKRIYLVGVSGGGHMAMMMLGNYPKKFSKVTAWVGISDLNKWHELHQDGGYGANIRALCGGNPLTNRKARKECRKRSPLKYLNKKIKTKVHLFAGINDGHGGSVPISHTIEAYNKLVPVKRRVSKKDKRLLSEREIPFNKMKGWTYNETLYTKKFKNKQLTIFDGGHEIDYLDAIEWLSLP